MSSIPGKFYFAYVIYNHIAHRSAATDDHTLSLKVTEYIAHLLKSWGYKKIYYHEKDALPGRNIFDELFRVINGSEWTIVVLTKGFVDDGWGFYCQQTAFKRLLDKQESSKLLPIAIDLNDSSIPNNLNINGIVFIDGEWENNPGWEKLKRVLNGESVTDTQPPAPSDAPYNCTVLQETIYETQDENPRIHSEIGDRSFIQSTRGVSGNGRTSSGISPPINRNDDSREEPDTRLAIGRSSINQPQYSTSSQADQTQHVQAVGNEIGDRSLMQSTRGVSGNGRTSSGISPPERDLGNDGAAYINLHEHNSDIEEDHLPSENVSRIGWMNDVLVNQVSSSTDSEESESVVSETVPKSYVTEQPEKFDGADSEKSSGYFTVNEVASTQQPDCHEKKDTSAEEKISPWKKYLLNSLVHMVSKSEMPFM